jgi:hypothetical protein
VGEDAPPDRSTPFATRSLTPECRPAVPFPGGSSDEAWRYSSLARLWSWSLIVVGGLLLLLSIAIQAARTRASPGAVHLRYHWITGRRSSRSSGCGCAGPRCRRCAAWAARATGPRRPGQPARWRRCAGHRHLLVGGAAADLPDRRRSRRPAEGVVVGVLAARGAATLEDAAIRAAEEAEGGGFMPRAGAPLASAASWFDLRRDARPA